MKDKTYQHTFDENGYRCELLTEIENQEIKDFIKGLSKDYEVIDLKVLGKDKNDKISVSVCLKVRNEDIITSIPGTCPYCRGPYWQGDFY